MRDFISALIVLVTTAASGVFAVPGVVPPSIIITSGASIPAHNGLYAFAYHLDAGSAALVFTTNETIGWSYTLTVDSNNTLQFFVDEESFTASIAGEPAAGMLYVFLQLCLPTLIAN